MSELFEAVVPEIVHLEAQGVAHEHARAAERHAPEGLELVLGFCRRADWGKENEVRMRSICKSRDASLLNQSRETSYLANIRRKVRMSTQKVSLENERIS
jgi:hypothetical protein